MITAHLFVQYLDDLLRKPPKFIGSVGYFADVVESLE